MFWASFHPRVLKETRCWGIATAFLCVYGHGGNRLQKQKKLLIIIIFKKRHRTLNFFPPSFKAIWAISTIPFWKPISIVASAATCGHIGSLGFDLAFFYDSFPFSPLKRISIFKKICSIHCACRDLSVILARTASCLINANNRLLLHVEEVNIKIQRSCCHRWCITLRLKCPRSLVSSFLACYKNNLGYKVSTQHRFYFKSSIFTQLPK